MGYKYETHLHTSPVSACAKNTVRENLEFYKSRGFDGVFITNHFLDGNIGVDRSLPYEQQIEFYFSDYEEAKRLSDEVGIKVFFGAELSYGGTDFLIYGLDKKWFLDNPQIMDMKKSDELNYLMANGAFVIQAHPYREASYIDHIRLFPRHVHGVEVINACRTELENKMADIYAENYSLIKFAGSDNHICEKLHLLAGMETEVPVESEQDFIRAVKDGKATVFSTINK